jgi:hypothetical protein
MFRWRRTPKDDPRAAPGPQMMKSAPTGTAAIVYLALLISAFLVLHAYLKANPMSSVPSESFPWRLKLLDLNDSISLFLALVGVAVVREQYARANRPYITYRGQLASPTLLTAESAAEQVWQVKISNVGPGMALLKSAQYRLPSENKVKSEYALTLSSVHSFLDHVNLQSHKDYVVAEITDGAALGADSDFVVCEVRAAHLATIKAIDLKLTVFGVLGDAYDKEIFLVPRGWLSAEPARQEV